MFFHTADPARHGTAPFAAAFTPNPAPYGATRPNSNIILYIFYNSQHAASTFTRSRRPNTRAIRRRV